MFDSERATTRRCVGARRLDEEMKRTAPLDADEVVTAAGVVRCRTSFAFHRLAYLRVSPTRICIVKHYAFGPDKMLEIPRSALTGVSTSRRPWVALDIQGDGGATDVRLRPWERLLRRTVAEPVLRVSPEELCSLLS